MFFIINTEISKETKTKIERAVKTYRSLTYHTSLNRISKSNSNSNSSIDQNESNIDWIPVLSIYNNNVTSFLSPTPKNSTSEKI